MPIFELKGGNSIGKNEFKKQPDKQLKDELDRVVGQPGKDDIIFVHLPNPGTCVYYRGTWY